MNLPSGTRPERSWVYVTVIIFMMQSPLSSAGGRCPPQNKMDSCLCFQDPEMRGALPTTPIPIPMMRQKVTAEEPYFLSQKEDLKPENEEGSLSQEVKRNTEIKSVVKEYSLTVFPSSPPANATCCTVVSCSAPKSLLALQDTIANALSRKWVDKLIVSHLPPEKGYSLVRFPAGWLKTLRVKHFEVRDTLLSGDFIHYGTPFEGQEQSMLWFTARNCYLSGSLTYEDLGTVNTKGLNYMSTIEGVDLSRNHLVYISSTGFRYPPTNLSTINLSYNSIQSIAATCFHYTPLLKRLDLSHNLLGAIARNIFAAPARNLQHIDLSWNQLKVLPSDLFGNMPQLKVLILGNNFLTSMPNEPWATVWRQLTFIDVRNNFVLCDCSLMWLLPILSPPVTNVSTTPAPAPLKGQLVLGACSDIKPNSYAKLNKLTSITRSSLSC